MSDMNQVLVGKQEGFILGLFIGSQSRGDGSGVDDQILVHHNLGQAGRSGFRVVAAQESNSHVLECLFAMTESAL